MQPIRASDAPRRQGVTRIDAPPTCAGQSAQRSTPDAASRRALPHTLSHAPFVMAVRAALTQPGVQAHGTTPGCPIMTWGNTLEKLTSGTPDTIAQVCTLIAAAKTDIALQIYEWDDADESARHVMAALEARVVRAWQADHRPLRIRIIVNQALGGLWRQGQPALRALAARIASHTASPQRVSLELCYYRGLGFNIMHSKSLIIDNRAAMLLTGNFKTHKATMAHDWYNMGAVWTGPVVRTIQADWQHCHDASKLVVRVPAAAPAAAAHNNRVTPSSQVYAKASALGACVLTRRAHGWLGAEGRTNPQAQALLAMIGATCVRIVALNPALNAPPIVDALVDAMVARQIEVHLLLSLNMDRSRQHYVGRGDNAEVSWRMYDALLKAGGPTAAARLHIAFAADARGMPGSEDSPYNMHAKAAAFDNDCLLIGSMNWDWQSWNNSRELSVASFGPDVVESWTRQIYMPQRSLAAEMTAQDLPKKRQTPEDAVYQFLRAGRPVA